MAEWLVKERINALVEGTDKQTLSSITYMYTYIGDEQSRHVLLLHLVEARENESESVTER